MMKKNKNESNIGKNGISETSSLPPLSDDINESDAQDDVAGISETKPTEDRHGDESTLPENDFLITDAEADQDTADCSPVKKKKKKKTIFEIALSEESEDGASDVDEGLHEVIFDESSDETDSEVGQSFGGGEFIFSEDGALFEIPKEFLPEEKYLSPDNIFALPTDSVLPNDDAVSEDEFSTETADTEPREKPNKREADEDGEVSTEDGQYTISDIPQTDSNEESDEEIEYVGDGKRMADYDPEKPRHIDARFDFVELFVFTLAVVLIITSFFFRHSTVQGESMENTLFEGEHLIISDLFYTPKTGDIIVCDDHTTILKKPIVKRVIATEGQTVKIVKEGLQYAVYVDGVKLNEDYVHIDKWARPDDVYNEFELTVPDNEIFVMGDHRNQSTDSRIIGTISEDSVLGRVLFRFYPFDKFGPVN